MLGKGVLEFCHQSYTPLFINKQLLLKSVLSPLCHRSSEEFQKNGEGIRQSRKNKDLRVRRMDMVSGLQLPGSTSFGPIFYS